MNEIDEEFSVFIEFCGPACAQYQSVFLQSMIAYCKDKQPEVRQAALYGCGILAQCGGEQFAQTCSMMMPVLVEAIMSPDAREPENMTVTENAISAVAKIMKYNSSAITNRDEIINLWYVLCLFFTHHFKLFMMRKKKSTYCKCDD